MAVTSDHDAGLQSLSTPASSRKARSAPRSPHAAAERFRQVQASLSRLQELDTAPASLKSQRFDMPADDDAPGTLKAPLASAAEARDPSSSDSAAPTSSMVRGLHVEAALDATGFDLTEAIDHAAARELPADTLRGTVRRLGQYALLNLAVTACFAVVGGLLFAASPKVGGANHAGSLVPLLAGALLNLGQLALTRVRALAPRTVVMLGFLHLVLYCLALSVFRHSQPWPAHEALRSWSPAAVAIVLFGALIPVRPAQVLLWGLVAAAMDPLAALLSGSTAGSASALLLLSLSPLLGSGLAYFSSTLTHDLSERISRARDIGSYKLIERLGSGGMGDVWRADHRMLARGAAIKLIRPSALSVHDPAEARRVVRLFELEAQATTVLTSPHTINIYDFGVTTQGHFYYAMELLDGFDLQELVEKHGPQPAPRVAHILAQVADSLGEAHGHGYVHRDVKPANVFLCRYGGRVDFVKVLDFGLVLEAPDDDDDGADNESATPAAPARAIGTPSIMAPEMLAAGGRVDHRSDLYALGCLGYWLLTGARVFPAKTRPEMLRMHASVVPERPSVRSGRPVPAELEDIIMKCLQKNPISRPQSALEIAEALDASGLIRGWSRDSALTFWERHACGPMSARLAEGA